MLGSQLCLQLVWSKTILKPFTSNTSCLLCMRLHVSALTGPSSGLLTNQVGNAAYMLGSQLCLQLVWSKIILKPFTSKTSYLLCEATCFGPYRAIIGPSYESSRYMLRTCWDPN